jgi:hypothetical protein
LPGGYLLVLYTHLTHARRRIRRFSSIVQHATLSVESPAWTPVGFLLLRLADGTTVAGFERYLSRIIFLVLLKPFVSMR